MIIEHIRNVKKLFMVKKLINLNSILVQGRKILPSEYIISYHQIRTFPLIFFVNLWESITMDRRF